MTKEDETQEMRDRFKNCQDAWSSDRGRYRDDLRFLSGEHWPAKILKEREDEGRPCLVVDKLNQYVRQVVNDARQNRPAIKVRPVDSFADVETAEVMQGLIRHIEERSSADIAYDTALECAVKGGMGFIRVLTEYAGDNTFNQDIRVKRVRNPLTVYIDPDCQEPDGSDMRFAFVVEDIPKDEFSELYPDATPIDFDSDAGKFGDWIGDKIRVAEYFYVEETDKNIHLLEDGTVTNDEEMDAAEKAGIPVARIVESRTIPTKCVYWAKTNGKEFLEKPKKWAGKFIPVIPVWGNEEDIDGELRHTGMIHNAKGAQQLYDFSRSAYAERVALTPKAPWVAATGQVDDHPEWNTANTASVSVLTYDPIDVNGIQVPPPMRQQAADIPAGFSEDMRLSEHDIQASIGMYEASLGQRSNEKSGKAIMARERSGDVATFHYHDNESRAIRQCGRIIVDLIPKIYDTKRVLRIIGQDGTQKMVETDPSQPEAIKKLGEKSIFNLGVGTYDVVMSSGPSYTTSRQEAADAMLMAADKNPSLWQTHGDIMAKAMDWPMADEFAARSVMTLPPELKPQPNMTPEIQTIVMDAQKEIQQREQTIQQMDQAIQEMSKQIESLEQQAELKMAEVQIKAKDSDTKQYEAETKRMVAVQPSFDAGEIKTLVQQTLIELTQGEPA